MASLTYGPGQHSGQYESSRFESPVVKGLPAQSLHVLPVCAWVISRCSGFFPPSKNMGYRRTGYSKLSTGVSASVNGRHLCVDWQLVLGDPASLPKSAGTGSNTPETPKGTKW